MVRVRKKCSHKGCTNGAVKGGVCITHGAVVMLDIMITARHHKEHVDMLLVYPMLIQVIIK
jgi:hypothetical protein